jgi:hypothetical protein
VPSEKAGGQHFGYAQWTGAGEKNHPQLPFFFFAPLRLCVKQIHPEFD